MKTKKLTSPFKLISGLVFITIGGAMISMAHGHDGNSARSNNAHKPGYGDYGRKHNRHPGTRVALKIDGGRYYFGLGEPAHKYINHRHRKNRQINVSGRARRGGYSGQNHVYNDHGNKGHERHFESWSGRHRSYGNKFRQNGFWKHRRHGYKSRQRSYW